MARRKGNLKSERNGNDLTRRIKAAAANLFYISETDAPVELFAGTAAAAVTQEILLSQIGKPTDSPVETRNFDEFFAPLVALQDWFGDEEKANAAKFAVLRDLLKNNLQDLKVFKIGSIELNVYAVGLDAESKLTGIKTRAVET